MCMDLVLRVVVYFIWIYCLEALTEAPAGSIITFTTGKGDNIREYFVTDKTAVIRDIAKSNYLVYSATKSKTKYTLKFVKERSGACTISGTFRTNFSPCTTNNEIPPAVCETNKGIFHYNYLS